MSMQSSDRFSFAFEQRYRGPARLFGVTEMSAWVTVGPSDLDAHFGRWRLLTPLSNIIEISVTGPYSFLKTVGPARLGITDLGLTFATNSCRGVLMRFAQRLPAIEPLGVIRHPELTVTVAEVDRFVEALRNARSR